VPEAECPERARADALGGEPPEEDERGVPLPERPARPEPGGARYVGGRRLRTY
jgi:hypothetical protein